MTMEKDKIELLFDHIEDRLKLLKREQEIEKYSADVLKSASLFWRINELELIRHKIIQLLK